MENDYEIEEKSITNKGNIEEFQNKFNQTMRMFAIEKSFKKLKNHGEGTFLTFSTIEDHHTIKDWIVTREWMPLVLMYENNIVYDIGMLGTWTDQQVPNTYSHYADMVMETLMMKVLPKMQKEVSFECSCVVHAAFRGLVICQNSDKKEEP